MAIFTNMNIPAILHHITVIILLLTNGLHGMYEEEAPKFIDEPPSKIEFINDSRLLINCTVKGTPKPKIKWLSSDSLPLKEISGLRYTTPYGTLVFTPFLPESFRPDVHSTSYRCLATNSVGSLLSRAVSVRGVVNQSYKTKVPTESVLKGFPAVLDCTVTPFYMKDHTIVTSWLKDESSTILPSREVPSINKSRYTVLQDGRLLIWQVRTEDSYSSFQCRILNKLTGITDTSSSGRVIVNEPANFMRPMIRQTITSVQTKQSSRIILPCIAYGHPKPSIRWMKKDKSSGRLAPILEEEKQRGESSIILFHGAIVIPNVKQIHEGLYVCNASNSEGYDVFEMVLSVRSPLVVNLEPTLLTADLGKSAEFYCSILGFTSSPISITWMKNGNTIQANNRIRFLGQNKLQIISVTREDQGVYQCFAKNNFDEVQNQSQLLLGDVYPQFIYRFIEQTLQRGPAISLKCSATGNPTPQVEWLLDGFPIPKSDRFLKGQYANVYGDVVSHVNITSVRVEDGGQYQCKFTSRAGTISHSATLNIYGEPFVRPMPDIFATLGKQLQIKCPAGGHPIDKFIWKKGTELMPQNDQQQTTKNGTLIFQEVFRSDAGTYKCIASNSKGESSSRTVRIRVIVPPKISNFKFPSDVQVGERASIQCFVEKGDKPMRITWYKDRVKMQKDIAQHHHHHYSQQFEQDGRKNVQKFQEGQKNFYKLKTNQLHFKRSSQSIQSSEYSSSSSSNHKQASTLLNTVIVRHMDDFTSTLSIPHLQPYHTGNYTCQAENNAAKTTYTTQLIVNVPPRILPFTFGEELKEGMRTQVICTTTQGDEPIIIEWLKDNKKLVTENNGIHIRYFPPYSSLLSIPNITSSHAGNFTCRVSNNAGLVLHTTQLIVSVPPTWQKEPVNESVSEGSNVIIHCSADGFPSPTITWKQAFVTARDDKEYRKIGYKTPRLTVFENGTLKINRVTKDHEGEYVCQGHNGVGPGINKIIFLNVNALPRMKGRPPKEMVRKGETGRIRCEAEGDLPITMFWMFDNTKINETYNPRITISNDGGTNGHRVLGDGGNGSSDRDVDGPANKERNDSVPTMASGQGNVESTVASTLTIDNVSKNDGGDYQCFAVNAFGQDSTKIFLMVQERPKTPKQFKVLDYSSRWVLLSWIKPSMEDKFSDIIDYVVRYKKETDSWSKDSKTISTSVDHSQIKVTNLTPSTVYIFRIYSRNEIDNSDPSIDLKQSTKQEPPGGPPIHLIVEQVSSQELKVSWKQPNPKVHYGIILGYNIGFKKFSSNTSPYNWIHKEIQHEFFKDQQEIFSIQLKHLQKFTQYEIIVEAYNEEGNGPPTQPFIQSTMEDVPESPPLNIECSATSSSISVSWNPPVKSQINGRIKSYNAFLELIDSNSELPGSVFGTEDLQEHIERESRVSTTSTTFTDLPAFSNFSIQVSAATSVGDGVLSTPTICTTKETVPGSPSQLKWMVSSPTSVILSWQKPKNSNGFILKYHVYIRLIKKETSGKLSKTVKRSLPYHKMYYEVKDLLQQQPYECWITAETGTGEGTPTGSSIVQTSQIVKASIVSFGRKILSPLKSDIFLPCIHVGKPTPKIAWTNSNMDVLIRKQMDRLHIYDDGALTIKKLQRNDNGNYSCFVSNSFGSDQISYSLKVQVPPGPPLLHSTSATKTSIRLQWKQGDNGDSPIKSYLLNFRNPDGEWEEILLSKKISTYVVKQLKCGQPYDFYLTGVNKVGHGLPSKTVSVRTQGERPEIPKSPYFLQSNSTSILLNLKKWNSTSECPITKFLIEYKGKHDESSDWKLVRMEPRLYDGSKSIIKISGLRPDTEYKVRVKAINGAGTSSAQYAIKTSKVARFGMESGNVDEIREVISTGSIPSYSSNSKRHNDLSKGQRVPFYLDLHIILPLVVSILAVLSAFASYVFCWKRKADNSSMMESTGSLAFRRDLYGRQGALKQPGSDHATIRSNNKYKLQQYDSRIPENSDDIHPYATFHLPDKGDLTENISKSFFHPSNQQRLTSAEAIPIRQIARNSVQTNNRRNFGKGNKKDLSKEDGNGESEEYDDSSDSEEDPTALTIDTDLMNQNPLQTTLGHFRTNDETLLASERELQRKSLTRHTNNRHKFLFGTGGTGNGGSQRIVKPIVFPLGYDEEAIGNDASSLTTTSFVYENNLIGKDPLILGRYPSGMKNSGCFYQQPQHLKVVQGFNPNYHCSSSSSSTSTSKLISKDSNSPSGKSSSSSTVSKTAVVDLKSVVPCNPHLPDYTIAV